MMPGAILPGASRQAAVQVQGTRRLNASNETEEAFMAQWRLCSIGCCCRPVLEGYVEGDQAHDLACYATIPHRHE